MLVLVRRKCAIGVGVLLVGFVCSEARAGSKYFKENEFPYDAAATCAVKSGDEAVLTVSDPEFSEVNGSGKGECSFLVNCVGPVGATTNVKVTITYPDGKKRVRLVDFVQKACDIVSYPAVEGCGDDIICTSAGDTRETAIDVTDCTMAIPAVSEWGLAALTLLVLAGGTVVLMRRRAAAAA